MLITGTRKGIGAQLAKHYAGKGYQVIGCSRKEIDFELNNYHHFRLDVANETEVKKTVIYKTPGPYSIKLIPRTSSFLRILTAMCFISLHIENLSERNTMEPFLLIFASFSMEYLRFEIMEGPIFVGTKLMY